VIGSTLGSPLSSLSFSLQLFLFDTKNPSDKITSIIVNNIFDKTQNASKIQIEG
jgi:hypothetical protein